VGACGDLAGRRGRGRGEVGGDGDGDDGGSSDGGGGGGDVSRGAAATHVSLARRSFGDGVCALLRVKDASRRGVAQRRRKKERERESKNKSKSKERGGRGWV
jgi:hypothetical protein